MNRRNFAVTALALTAMALAPLTACSKDKGGGGASGGSADILSYIPKDTTVVVGISMAKGRNSDLFKKYQDKFMKDAPPELAQLKEKCGLDPLSDIGSVVVSMGKDPKDDSDMVIAFKGSFDQAKIEKCITDMGGTVEGSAYKINGETINTWWAAKDTVLIAKEMTGEAIKAAATAGSVKDNKDIMAMVGKVDSSATVWAAAQIPAEAAGMMGGMGKPPKAAYMTVNVDSGVSAKVGLQFESADDAKGMSTMAEMGLNALKGQAGPMKDVVESIKVETSGDTLVVTGKVSGEQLDSLSSMGGLPF